jgi:predicted transcriptional regulator
MSRAAASRDLPPPLELLCLKALWTLGEGSVNDVRRIVGATKPLAYTTVMTLLDRLARKGAASRHKAGRSFVYAAQISQHSVRRLAFREFLNSHFDGSAEQLLDFLHHGSEERVSANAAAASFGHLDTTLL